MDLTELLNAVDAAVWGPPMIILLLGCHIYTTIRTKVIQRKLPLALKLSVTKDDGAEGDVSNFGAMATSLASTLGTGSIGGSLWRSRSGTVDVAHWYSWYGDQIYRGFRCYEISRERLAW